METELDLDSISSELDAVHVAARRAFRARDLDAYRDFFTDDLRYLQPDGNSIGRKELMRDVGKQLSQYKAVDSEMTRESISINNDGTVTQIMRQNGAYSVSVFFVFTKTWKIERKGKYTYLKTDDGWRICDVEVQSEAVNSTSRVQQDEK
jgi:ketosteroid isomerase-like protein